MAKVPRRTYRLGYGAYTADHFAVTADARNRFLAAVRTVKPAVLDALAAAPFTAFEAALNADDIPGYCHQGGWETLETWTQDEEFGPLLVPLYDALARWGRQWRLVAPWCLDVAIDTLRIWRESPTFKEGRHWAPIISAGFLPLRRDERRFTFIHEEGWEPTSDTRQEAEAGIRRAFERDLVAYLDWIEECALERGLVPTLTKKNDTGFEWLARVLVDQCSRQEIADEVGKGRRAVEQAVSDAAQLVGIVVPHREN